MVEIIAISVAASFATIFSKFNFISPPTSIISVDSLRISFKVEELGFFDLEFPIEYGLGDVIRTSKNTIYRSVYLFV